MMQFPYRLALSVMLLATSLMVWTATAGAYHYIDRTGAGASRSQEIVVVTPAAATGFDWTDAGIGAATAVGLLLAAGGAYVVVLRHRRSAAFS
jgi:hypothetical protein